VNSFHDAQFSASLDSSDGPEPPVSAYARVSPREKRFLEDLRKSPPLGSMTIAEERARMQRGQTAKFEDYAVEVDEFASGACVVHIIRPRAIAGELPITFYLHGGGWVLGGLKTHTMLLCELALRSGRAIAFLEYPLAPETQFPETIEICETAIRDTLRDASELGLSSSNFVLAGDSSGGNIALSLALALQRSEHIAPASLVLLYPVTDHAMDSASYIEFAEDPNLSRQAMSWFWEQYLPEERLGMDARASPLRADKERFRGFPPTLIITCECDVLRDQGEALAAELIQAGVEVTAVRWLGALHGFLITEELLRAPKAQQCVDFVSQYCRQF
jgi:acetyl esterase